MMSPRHLVFFVALATLLTACGGFNNRYHEIQEQCRYPTARGLSSKTVVRLRDPEGNLISPMEIGKLAFFAEGAPTGTSLPLSPGGCVAFDAQIPGSLEAAVPTRLLGGAWSTLPAARSDRLIDLSLQKVAPLEVEIRCPRKTTVGSVEELLLPASLATREAGMGTRFFLEIRPNAAADSYLVPASLAEQGRLVADPSLAFRPLPNGRYSVTAQARDVLGRNFFSESCILDLDAREPSQPQPLGKQVVSLAEPIEISESPEFRTFVCFEPLHGPTRSDCAGGVGYTEVRQFVRVPGQGRWRAYAFSQAPSGKRSPLRTWEVVGDGAAPAVSLRWNNPELRGYYSIARHYETQFKVDFSASDDADGNGTFGGALECKVELRDTTRGLLHEGKATCDSEPCRAKPLDAWTPCQSPLVFSLKDERSLWNIPLVVKVRATDAVGNAGEGSLSAWLLQDALDEWNEIEAIQNPTFSGNNVTSIIPYGWGMLAAQGGDVVSLNPLSRRRNAFAYEAMELFQDLKGSIWVGGRNGRVSQLNDDLSSIHEWRLNIANDDASIFTFPNQISGFWQHQDRVFTITYSGAVTLLDSNQPFPGLQYPFGETTILRVRSDEQGTVWILNSQGLWRQDAMEKWIRIKPVPNVSGIVDFLLKKLPDGKQVIWIQSDSGIIPFFEKDGELSAIPGWQPGPADGSLLFDGPEGLPATFTQGERALVHLMEPNGIWKTEEVRDPLLRDIIQHLQTYGKDRSGRKWFGGIPGMFRYDGCHWMTFPKTVIGTSNSFTHVMPLKTLGGDIVAVDDQGMLFQFHNNGWKEFSALPEHAGALVDLSESADNQTIVAMLEGTILAFDPSQPSLGWHENEETRALSRIRESSRSRTMPIRDDTGRYWTLSGSKIQRWGKDGAEIETLTSGLPLEFTPRVIKKSANGHFHILGETQGLSQHFVWSNDAGFRLSFSQTPNASDSNFLDFAVGGDDTAWYISSLEVIRIQNGQMSRYHSPALQALDVKISLDNAGRPWVASGFVTPYGNFGISTFNEMCSPLL